MIVHIEGKIIAKNPDFVILDVNGLGYECSISNLNPKIIQVTKIIKDIYLIILKYL